MYDVFFSYSRQDQDAVERVATALRERGLKVFLDRWYLVSGRPWVDELEKTFKDCRAVAVFIGPSGIGRWQQREKEFALDRQAENPSFPVIPVLLPGADPALGFLQLNTWVDLRAGLTADVTEILVHALRGHPLSQDLKARAAGALASICPYRGLLHFREEDVPFFFGRQAVTDELLETVASHNLVAVVGASGCGKSSLVRAGLIPGLRRSGRSRLVWDAVSMFPRERPLRSLAERFVTLLEPETNEAGRLAEAAKLAGMLDNKDVAFRTVIERVLERQPGTNRLLLVVDQWEELYTLCRDESERQRFFDELLDALSAGRLTVIFVLRVEFYARMLDNRALSDRLQDAIVNVGPMTRSELRSAIVEPANSVALKFEDGLVDRILDDVGDAPGGLPLLEFVLFELWERRAGGMLLHESYSALGGIRGALVERAERAFAHLSSAEQSDARWVSVRLVAPGRDGMDTRRRAMLADLEPTARNIVEKLANERVLVTGREHVEFAHGAIIREWGRLRGWIEEERQTLEMLLRLEEEAALCMRDGQSEDMLLAGRKLLEAAELLHERPQTIAPRVRQYIEASIAASQKRAEAERQTEISRQAEARDRARLEAELERIKAERAHTTAGSAEPARPAVSGEPNPGVGGHEPTTPEFWLHYVTSGRNLSPGDAPLVTMSYSSEDQIWMDLLRKLFDPRIELLRDPDGSPYQMWDFSDAKRGTRPGDEFPIIVAEKMWRCRAAIVVLSADYFNSKYCRTIELPFLMWRRRYHELPCLFVRLGTFSMDRVRIPNYRDKSGADRPSGSSVVSLPDIIDDRQAAEDFAQSPHRKLSLKQLREQNLQSEIEDRFAGLARGLIQVLKDRYGALEDY